MITTLISFLGGSVFRTLWGEISAWLTKQQDQSHEIERLKLQAQIDAEQHKRNLETYKAQAEAGIKVIEQQAAAAMRGTETDAWLEAVKGTTQKVGVTWVDAWNSLIRPLVATWAIAVITIHYANAGWVLDDNGWGLCGAALGIYLADRALFKRGK